MKGFTDTGIQKMKPGKSKKTITEGNGFYLQISPKGRRTWYHRYESAGRRKWIKIGEYPAMSLKEAREANEKLLAETMRGEDPAEKIQIAPTVRELFEQWIGKAVGPRGTPWSEGHKRNTMYIFKSEVLPRIGGMKVGEVRKRDIRAILDKVNDRAPNQALQLYRRLNRLFNWAAELDIIEASPMASLPVIGTQGKKDRYLKKEEIKVFLRSLPSADMAPNTAAILEIILRTGQRPSEVAGIHEKEIQGDWWILPAERAKNGMEHRIYLTDKVKSLLGNPNQNGLFFPSLTNPAKPVGHTVLSKALRRSTGGKEKRSNDEVTIPVKPFTPHDLRRTCATSLAELEFPDEVIAAVLNHKKNGVTGIYNRFQYDAEKKRALLALERRLEEICTSESKPAGGNHHE